jgi:hypothetical protein
MDVRIFEVQKRGKRGEGDFSDVIISKLRQLDQNYWENTSPVPYYSLTIPLLNAKE